jgi:hypothetical protein
MFSAVLRQYGSGSKNKLPYTAAIKVNVLVHATKITLLLRLLVAFCQKINAACLPLVKDNFVFV